MEAQLLRPADAARRLGVSRRTVLALLKQGRMPGVRLSRAWLIPTSELDAFLERLREEARRNGGLPAGSEPLP